MKKGFFFAIAIFLLLGYIVLSISAWTANIQITEQRMSERFALQNARNILSQISEETVEKNVHSVVANSLHELNQHTQESERQTVKVGQGNDWEFKYINQTMYALVLNGTADGRNFEDRKEFVRPGHSLDHWRDQLNDSMLEIGYRLSAFDVDKFGIGEMKGGKLGYNLTIHLRAESREGRTVMDKTYDIKDSVDITGFVDSATFREGQKKNSELKIQKQFYFHEDYPTPIETRPTELNKKGVAGQSWFYGNLVDVGNAASIATLERPTYMLMGEYRDIKNLGNPDVRHTDFGAYLVTDDFDRNACQTETNTFNPIQYDGGCTPTIDIGDDFTPKPFVVVPGFSINNDAADGPNGKKTVLFIAIQEDNTDDVNLFLKNKEVLLYDIEKLRDFAICGYYTQNADAPSYLQRLLPDSYKRTSKLGIESMIIGTFIGGENIPDQFKPAHIIPDERSRLDRELFTDVLNPIKIRGLPGCKTAVTCGGPTPIGHFRLGADGIKDYIDTSNIQCNDGRADCG
jgi:hypothetical protein